MSIAVRLSEADLAHICTAIEEALEAESTDLTVQGLEQLQALHARLSLLYAMAYRDPPLERESSLR